MTTATGSPTWHTLSLASAGCAAIFIGEPSLEWIIQPQIRLPILSDASCAPVSTASTPGIAVAALVSTFLILAWACGERTNIARVSPGRLMSSVYWPLPVMKRRSSVRRTAAPMPVAAAFGAFPAVEDMDCEDLASEDMAFLPERSLDGSSLSEILSRYALHG